MSESAVQTIKLRHAVLHYVGAMIVLMLVAYIEPPFPFVLEYLGIGIYLSRAVLRRLIDWHPVNDTIGNRFNTKVFHLVFWPLAYPLLFLILSVNRWL